MITRAWYTESPFHPLSMALIGIDCRFGGAYGGLGTYTRELVTALVARKDDWSYVLFVSDRRLEWLKPFQSSPRVRIVEAGFPHYSVAEQLEFPNLIQDAEADLLFFPHFNVPLSCPVPFVCTVHDLILHRFPNESGWLRRLAYRFVLRQALSRARAVCTVSDFTKSDIRSVYGAVFDHKLNVVYPGISPNFVRQSEELQQAFRMKYGLEHPFLLYIGNCKEHKNVGVLVDAYERSGLQGIDLVLLTGGRESAHLRRVKGLRVLSGLADQELPVLMSAALACVTATLLEGFCLPLVEAMACRTPALGTWAGPIPEVCGTHALFVEPTVSGVSEGLRSISMDQSYRSASRLGGAEAWAKAFTWERTAKETASLLSKHLPS